MRNCKLLLFLGIAFFWAGASSAFAQKDERNLEGQVIDRNGAVVAGATVTLRAEAAVPERSVQTDTEGEFLFEEISNGTYLLTVTGNGCALRMNIAFI